MKIVYDLFCYAKIVFVNDLGETSNWRLHGPVPRVSTSSSNLPSPQLRPGSSGLPSSSNHCCHHWNYCFGVPWVSVAYICVSEWVSQKQNWFKNCGL